jgi:protein disulfide-isomerase-like protein
MLKTAIFALLSAIFLAVQCQVIDLTDANFDSFLEKTKTVMVEFYAPWCGHCKKFAPEYEAAAKRIKEQEKPYVVARVDCEKNTKVRGKIDIKSFPTIKMYVNGTATEYTGERTGAAVMDYLDKLLSPRLSSLDTVEEINKIKNHKGIRVIKSLIL